MNRTTRLSALEDAANAAGIYLHCPSGGDDHAAEWTRALASGQRIGVVCFPGLDEEVVAAFYAAKPAGAR